MQLRQQLAQHQAQATRTHSPQQRQQHGQSATGLHLAAETEQAAFGVALLRQPASLLQPVAITGRTSRGGREERTSTTVVRSLLAARRKNTRPTARSRVSSRVEPRAGERCDGPRAIQDGKQPMSPLVGKMAFGVAPALDEAAPTS